MPQITITEQAQLDRGLASRFQHEFRLAGMWTIGTTRNVHDEAYRVIMGLRPDDPLPPKKKPPLKRWWTVDEANLPG
jgi:hypothetical protein